MQMEGEANNMMRGFKHLETAYVAGLSVITSVLDLLLCQQYFNPHMMALMSAPPPPAAPPRAPHASRALRAAPRPGQRRAAPHAARGVGRGSYQILLGESRDAGPAGQENFRRAAVIQFAAVPEEFFGRTFGELFHACNEREASIVVGLYREVGDPAAAQHYVYTNPSEDTCLRDTDRMYVIRESSGVARP